MTEKKKNSENRDKNNFFSSIFSTPPPPFLFTLRTNFSIFLCANQKLEQKACKKCANLCVMTVLTQIGCDILDVRKFVFHPKKSSQFLLLNLHSSLISFVYWSDREIATTAAFATVLTLRLVAIWTNWPEAVVFVVRSRSQ